MHEYIFAIPLFCRDAVRKSKVKQIFGWLQQERGESRSERLKNKKTDNKTRPKKA